MFWCKVGIHRYIRGVTGWVDRCKRCGKTREHFDDYGGY